jgi:hypothetical protein
MFPTRAEADTFVQMAKHKMTTGAEPAKKGTR